MRKILFFCDKCKNMIASQRLALGYQEEKHLHTVGQQEWCKDCIYDLEKMTIGILDTVNVNDPEFGLEKDTICRVKGCTDKEHQRK